MRHYDYEWDLYPNYLKLDKELDVDKLGWRDGDYFKFVVTEDGTKLIKKLDPLTRFLERGANNLE
jgi:hypothetical protein